MTAEPSGADLWLAMLRSTQAMDAVARQSMDRVGLGFSDFVLLEALLHLGPLTPSALGDKVGLTSGSITAAVDRLERRGLLQRADNPLDGRSRLVELLPAGSAIIEPAYAEHAADLQRVFASALSALQRRELFELLGRVRKTAQEETR
jgi:MarR family 2-MHQ and catechol resistance regulon transcriptional repressor